MADILITLRQAAALVSARAGRKIGTRRLTAILEDVVERDPAIVSAESDSGAWACTPDGVDVLAGEVIRRTAPWTRRSLVVQGFRAWVDDGHGVRTLLLLPYAWHDDRVVGEVGSIPLELPIVEWPTARVVGRLTSQGNADDGRPLYVRCDVGDVQTAEA